MKIISLQLTFRRQSGCHSRVHQCGRHAGGEFFEKSFDFCDVFHSQLLLQADIKAKLIVILEQVEKFRDEVMREGTGLGENGEFLD